MQSACHCTYYYSKIPYRAYCCMIDRAAVQKVYEDSLSAGGKGNGEPGLRKGYSPTYFSAYFFDPVGNNVEAVTLNAE